MTLFEISGQTILLAYEGKRQIALALAGSSRRLLRFITRAPAAPLLP